jgi:hypothetical protein
VARLERQIARLRRGMDRLIDSYAEEVIDADEFKPRLSGLKQRLARLQTERDQAAAAHEAEHSLQLVIGRLEEFASRVRAGLDGLDWHGQRAVIRALVRRIEIDRDQVEVVFRIPGMPSPDGGAPARSGPGAVGKPTSFRQHCGASYHRLIGAVLLEANDEWQLQHRYMQVEAMAELLAPDPDPDAETPRLPPLAA